MSRTALLAVALALAACGNRPSQNDCIRAVDHMIDIFAAPRVASGSIPADLKRAAETWKKGLKTKDPVRGALLERCHDHMTGAHVTCILAASDEDGLAKCFGG